MPFCHLPFNVSLLSKGWNETREPFGSNRTAMGISEKMGDVLSQAVEAKLLREVLEHEIQPQHLAIIMDLSLIHI